MKGLTMDEIKIGDKGPFTKTISRERCFGYAGITGDLNPAHVNKIEGTKYV